MGPICPNTMSPARNILKGQKLYLFTGLILGIGAAFVIPVALVFQMSKAKQQKKNITGSSCPFKCQNNSMGGD